MANLILGNQSGSGTAGYSLLLDATLKVYNASSSEINFISGVVPGYGEAANPNDGRTIPCVSAVTSAINTSINSAIISAIAASY